MSSTSKHERGHRADKLKGSAGAPAVAMAAEVAPVEPPAVQSLSITANCSSVPSHCSCVNSKHPHCGEAAVVGALCSAVHTYETLIAAVPSLRSRYEEEGRHGGAEAETCAARRALRVLVLCRAASLASASSRRPSRGRFVVVPRMLPGRRWLRHSSTTHCLSSTVSFPLLSNEVHTTDAPVGAENVSRLSGRA